MNKLSVLFVCTENICRSPLAEALLKKHLKLIGLHRQVRVDSAGTHCSAPKMKPDPRAVKVGKAQGLSFWGIKARRIDVQDFERFDLIVAMDETNRQDLLKQCPEDLTKKLHLIMRYASRADQDEVPDPYYGNTAGFQRVYDLLNDAIEGLIDELRPRVHH